MFLIQRTAKYARAGLLLSLPFAHMSAWGAEPQKYAVLINGGVDKEHNESEKYHTVALRKMFDSLVARGVPPENIYILNADGSNHTARGKISGHGKEDLKADFKNIGKTFDILKKRMKGEDQLLVTMTDHGGGKGLMSLWDNQGLTPTLLNKELMKLPEQATVNVVGSYCFSGGLIARIKRKNTCVYTRTNEYGISFSDRGRPNFIDFFAEGIAKGRSMDGAFDHARRMDHPSNVSHSNSLSTFMEATVEKSGARESDSGIGGHGFRISRGPAGIRVTRPSHGGPCLVCPVPREARAPSDEAVELAKTASNFLGSGLSDARFHEAPVVSADELKRLKNDAEAAEREMSKLETPGEKMDKKHNGDVDVKKMMKEEERLHEELERLYQRIDQYNGAKYRLEAEKRRKEVEREFIANASLSEVERYYSLKRCGNVVY